MTREEIMGERLLEMENLYVERVEKVKECLKSVQIIKAFLESEREYENDIEWLDKNKKGFSADMGYFYEGLDEFEKYLHEKIEE